MVIVRNTDGKLNVTNVVPEGCDAVECFGYAEEVCWEYIIDCELCVGGFAFAGGCERWRECGDKS